MDTDTSEAGRIIWADASLLDAMSRLYDLPAGREVASRIGIEYLVALFLDAADLDVEAALDPLRRAAEWREKSGAAVARTALQAAGRTASIHDSRCPYMEEVSKHIPLCEGGKAVDRRGLPYAVRCLGIAELGSLLSKASVEQLVQWQIFVTEWRLMQLEAYALQTGRLTGITIINDMHAPKGLLALWRKDHENIHVMQRMTSIVDSYYPGVLSRVLLVNAPWALHAILQVVRPLLPLRIAQRIEVLPASMTAQRLQELIESSSLPAFLGGEASDEEFIPNRQLFVAPRREDDSTTLIVDAGSQQERTLFLEEGDIASYGFQVSNERPTATNQDILFSARFDRVAKDALPEQVCIPTRVVENSGGCSFVAPQSGVFVMVFDNSYSWFNAKTISFELHRIPAPCNSEVVDQVQQMETPRKYETAEVFSMADADDEDDDGDAVVDVEES